MPGAAKTRRMTEVRIQAEGIGERIFRVTKERIERVLAELEGGSENERDFIPAEDVFPDLKDPVKRAAAMLRGLRHREDLTQIDLAKKIGVSQGDVSGMESGSRPIGKEMAQRIGKVFKIDYRVLL
jgi:DNA-binding XRE family transcriptional regulator